MALLPHRRTRRAAAVLALVLTSAGPLSAQRADRPSGVDARALAPSGEMVDVHIPASGRLVLPLTSLGDTVLRPGVDRAGRFVLDLPGAPEEVRATVVDGPRDSIVVDDGVEGPRCFTALTLPRAVTAGEEGAFDLVARAARRDDVALGVPFAVQVTAPEGAGPYLLVFDRPSSPTDAAAGTRARVLEARDGAFRIDRPAAVDALFFARAAAPSPDRWTPACEQEPLEGGGVRLGVDLSGAIERAAEGERALTLVLELGAAPAPASPAAASAPRETPAPALRIVDSTDALNAHVAHLEGPAEQLDIRPTMGPGAAWGDVDGDGHLDLVVLQGAGAPGCAPLTDRLLLGREGGGFRDASEASGLAAGDAGMGALLVDLDGDAHLDLYCANYGRDRLFLGAGDGTFRDASDLLPDHDLWSASVIAGDVDGDGDLDLYVTSYLDYDPAKMPDAAELGRYQREDPIEMLPFAFPGQRNVMLLNRLAEDGELDFVDVTEERGLLDVQGRGMQAVFWDFDLDGDEDLYVANDVSFNVLFRNEGDGTFEDVSFSTGLDDPRGGMGLALGDVEGDGDEDLFLTNWELEANALYLNSRVQHGTRKRRRASFHDATVRSGLGRSGIGRTSWGAELCDLDHDGVLDLFVANGYTSPDYESTGICVGQPDLLFRGLARGRFEEVPLGPAAEGAEPPLAWRRASRGAIAGDLDRDGDLDLAVTSNNGPLRILENRSERRGGWLGVRLRRASGGNRFGIGARVTVTTPDGDEVHRTLRAGQGYLTGNPPEVHFGLGPVADDAEVDVRVLWPDGEETRARVRAGRWITHERAD